MPRIRSQPQDFQVEEIPLYPAAGHGEHTYVLIEKEGLTTEQVARRLARLAEVPPREVGYAGRKDRWALTRQWFSVPRLDPKALPETVMEGGRVLAAELHPHKLRTGHLRGNRFRVRLRDVSREDGEAALERLIRATVTGSPNRFGKQRFGHEGRNAESGLAVLRGERVTADRRHARFLVSALQSEVFNTVLQRREPPLDRVVAGDVAVVHASGGLFLVHDPAAEAERARRFEISPTGPIFGTKMMRPQGEVLALETRVMEEAGLAPMGELVSPRGLRLNGSRRALRVQPGEVQGSWEEEGVLGLVFTLPPGSYATVLIEELFPGQAVEEGPQEGQFT